MYEAKFQIILNDFSMYVCLQNLHQTSFDFSNVPLWNQIDDVTLSMNLIISDVKVYKISCQWGYIHRYRIVGNMWV